MKNNNKKILIVCWSFPPNPGIGGRRWAKFAKYLIKENYEVYVIKEQFNNTQSQSQWLEGIQIPLENIFEIKRHFLSRYLNYCSGFLGKITSRIAALILKMKEKGTIYDAAVGIKNDYIELLNKVIKTHQIDKIIVTGAPFNLFYYTALAVENRKQFITLADYRDPWIEAENYGMKTLAQHRKSNEILKQNLVFETFKYITSPSQIIFESMKNQYTGIKGIHSKFVELQHAFDQDDLGLIYQNTCEKNGDGNLIKITYGGTIYLETEHYLQEFSDFVADFNQCNHSKKIEVVFYTPDYLKFENRFSSLIFKKPIGNDIFSILNKSDFIILLYATHNMNFKTTKFFEFSCFNKPFLYLGPNGDVSNLIEKNNMGFVFDILNKADMQHKISNNYEINNDFLMSQNDFIFRTKELIQLLENQC